MEAGSRASAAALGYLMIAIIEGRMNQKSRHASVPSALISRLVPMAVASSACFEHARRFRPPHAGNCLLV